MKDGIIGFLTQNKILFLNAVAEKLLGVKEAQALVIFGAVNNDLMRTLPG
ncbi:MAG: hypothetical protein IPL50_12055 [Chitinophagaceae bacterium]|nr:hypothetical protein [Chitinophagaceae bacterium]